MTSGEPEPDEGASLEELMAGFRRSGGGATARFGAAQAAIVRDLVGQVAELVGGDTLDEGRRARGRGMTTRAGRRTRGMTAWPARTTWRR